MKISFQRQLIQVFSCVTALVAVILLSPLSAVYAEAPVVYETDTNGPIKTADLLEPGIVMVASLGDREDVDSFKVETTARGEIRFMIEPQTNPNCTYFWYAEVLDANRAVLIKRNVSGRYPTELTLPCAEPGIYYVRIYAVSGEQAHAYEKGFTTDPYWLTVTITVCEEETFCAGVESMGNDSLESADVLIAHVPMTGVLFDRGDVDYFKLETTYFSDLLFSFHHTQEDSLWKNYWNAEVLDSNGNVLMNQDIDAKKPSSFSVSSVEPGTYYLKISLTSAEFMNRYSDVPYTFTSTPSCVDHPELTDWVIIKEPSCTEDGQKAQLCTRCHIPVEKESLDRLEHPYGDWSVIREAKFLPGKKQRVCSSCGSINERPYLSVIQILVLVVVFSHLWIHIRTSKKEKKSHFGSYWDNVFSERGISGDNYSYYDPPGRTLTAEEHDDLDAMSKVFAPGELDEVTLEDIDNLW